MATAPSSTSTTKPPSSHPPIRALFFDLMGTCLNWHSSVTASLPPSISPQQRSALALSWRHAYFRSNNIRIASSLPPEPFDTTLSRTLDELLASDEYKDLEPHFTTTTTTTTTSPSDSASATISAKTRALASWHSQPPHPDTLSSLLLLHKRYPNLELFIHANGSTRLQLDLMRSSNLGEYFHLLMSSQMLGAYKPAKEMYESGLELVGYRAEEVVMVAAHRRDLRGARAVGMRTVLVRREMEDRDEIEGEARRKEDEGWDGVLGEEEGWLEGLGGWLEGRV